MNADPLFIVMEMSPITIIDLFLVVIRLYIKHAIRIIMTNTVCHGVSHRKYI